MSKKAIVGLLAGAFILGGILSTDNSPVTNTSLNIPTSQKIETTNTNKPSTGLSNDNYYINSSGNEVHSPAYTNNGGVPSGATARCRDGTYSFSQHRSGTCSHHGGVANWL